MTQYHGKRVIKLSIRYSNAVLKCENSLCTGFVPPVVACELSGFCGYLRAQDLQGLLRGGQAVVCSSIHTFLNSHLIVLF